MPVRAVFFDAGETLFDETRIWAGWADWIGVPRLTLFAVLGAVIERGEHHQRAFELVRPGFDLERAWAERLATGRAEFFGWEDLYPDVIPCLTALRAPGYRVGMAGNPHSPGFPERTAGSTSPLLIAKRNQRLSVFRTVIFIQSSVRAG